MSKHWEIVVFTAGLKDYADKILNELDTNHYISRRLYRDSCKLIDGTYVKDLNQLQKGVDLSKVVIVDNIAVNFQLQQDNGIEIKSWLGSD